MDVKDKKLILTIGILAVIGVGGYFLVKKIAINKQLNKYKTDCIDEGCELDENLECYCSDIPSNLTSVQSKALNKYKTDCLKKGCELDENLECYCKG